MIYGTGLGATNPALIPGVVPAEAAPLATLPQVTIGGDAGDRELRRSRAGDGGRVPD